jgi:UDP-N-acetylenolpyruvoylglucosamine reductase
MSGVPTTLGGVTVRAEAPLAPHLPLRACAGAAEAWVEVADEDQLVAVIRAARAEKLAVRHLPPLADALPPEGGLTGVCLRLGAAFEDATPVEGGLSVGASALLAPLGLRPGFEALRGAPGTLAEALAEGWITPMVARVRRFRGRGFEVVDGCPDADAKALVVRAVLTPGVRLPWVPVAGQAFLPVKRRDLRAVLRALSLGGLRLGDAALADDDPLVLTNRGDATPRQVRLLMAAVADRVHVAKGIELQERLMAPGRGGRL